jgi:transporter family protein
MKRPSLAIGSARAIRIRQFVMTVIIIGIYIVYYDGPHPSIEWATLSLLLGLFGYIPFYFFCQALQIGAIGVVNAIGNSFPLVVSFLSVYFLNVHLTLHHWLGIIVIIGGVATLSLGKNPKKNLSNLDSKIHTRACLLSLLACLLWGIFFTSVQVPNEIIGYMPHTLLIQLGGLMSAEIHIIYGRLPKRNISWKTLSSGLWAGSLAIVGSISFYKALGLGNPGIVTAFAGSSPVIGALFGVIILKEKLTQTEVFGITLAVFGVIILSLAKVS